MQTKRICLGVLVLAVFFLARVSNADDAATIKAKQHNAIAKKLFNLGLFAEAAKEYELAYKAKAVPAFLFNLAQCYKRLGEPERLERAVFFFRSYLKNVPDTPMRQRIEGEIEKLKRQVTELRKPAPIYRKWWFWSLVSAVTAAAVVTTVALQPTDQSLVSGSVPPHVYGGI